MNKIKLTTKSKIHIILFSSILSVIILSSCEEEKMPINLSDDYSLASDVVGTYTGTIQNSLTKENKTATLTVTMQNDSLITMHCVAEDFDTTITMQLYQNSDSIMLCSTGQDFYNQYQHDKNNYDFCYSQQSGWMNENWMNDSNCWGNDNTNWGNSNWAGNDQWNAWTNHLNTQHNQNDMHFGGFSLSENTCNYSFLMYNETSNYYEVFEGVNNN